MDASTLFTPWLETQCRMLDGALGGVVWLGAAGHDLKPAACWPATQVDSSAWLRLAQEAGRGGSEAFVLPLSGADELRYLIISPLHFAGGATGLVAIEVARQDRERLQSMLHLLRWGGVWLELLLKKPRQTQDQNQVLLLKMLARLLGRHECQAWVDMLAREQGCARVALAWRERSGWRLQALSGKSRFNPRSQAALSLAGEIVSCVEAGQPSSEHRQIAPLKDNTGKLIGGLLLERPAERPFTRKEQLWCAQFAAYAGPLLALDRAARPRVWQRGLAVINTGLQRLLGRGWFTFKLATVAALLLSALAALLPVDYRVSAPASLEGQIQRVVAAPRDGYVASAPVRAGDAVHSGDTLAVLDSHELELEAEKWRNQRAQWRKAYRQALADGERAEARIQHARVARADAELALVEAQLARNTLRAPMDGVVVSGDLSQSLDAPVSRGDVLFEVAPLDAYRVVLQVDDRDIAMLKAGQSGELTLDGLPGRRLSFSVDRITPVARVSGGRNRFRVEGELAGDDQSLRPGMAGTGKVTVGRRSLLWLAGHRTLDWLRIQAWSWWF